jgi:hypothetical protein
VRGGRRRSAHSSLLEVERDKRELAIELTW